MAGDQDGAFTCSQKMLIIHLQEERLMPNTY